MSEKRMQILRNRITPKLRLQEVSENTLYIGSPICIKESLQEIYPSAQLRRLKNDEVPTPGRSNFNYTMAFGTVKEISDERA